MYQDVYLTYKKDVYSSIDISLQELGCVLHCE